MADHSTSLEPTTQSAGANRPLLSALTRWWSPAATPETDPDLGYESAHPWALGDETAADGRADSLY